MPAFKHNQRILLAEFERGHKAHAYVHSPTSRHGEVCNGVAKDIDVPTTLQRRGKLCNAVAKRCRDSASFAQFLRSTRNWCESNCPVYLKMVSIMRSKLFIIAMIGLIAAGTSALSAQDDPVKVLVGRLDLQKYKATIKGLTQFGDRRQGTDRNRKAVDWIEAQLKSYGCTNTERIKYDYQPPPPRDPNAPRPGGAGAQGSQPPTAAGGGRPRGIRTKTGVNTDPNAQ